jgi:hypothetical protein
MNHRMEHMFSFFLLLTVHCPLITASDPDLSDKRDRQAQVQADTEQLSRRVGTMLRVLEHYKLDPAGEKKLLDEAAGTLQGLSQKQMTDVLAKLDAAMQAADDETTQKHVNAAYDGHREALGKLKGLLGRFDSVRDLDSAIARFEKLARDELELSFRVADVLQDSLDGSSLDINRRRRALRAEFPTARARHDADEQADYCRDFETILRQLDAIKPALHADHLERLVQGERLVQHRELQAGLVDLATRIRPEGMIENRHRDWARAVEGGWVSSGHLQEVAQSLRQPRDKVQVLREARQKLAAVIEQLTQEVRESFEFFSQSPGQQAERIAFGRRQPADDPIGPRARQHADASSRLGFSVRAIRHQIAGHAASPADGLARAADTLHLADQSFRKVAPLFARAFQALADAQLRYALADLDAAVHQAEKERSDSLVAAKAALDQVEQLIKEQQQVRDDTQKNAQTNNDDAAKKQAPKQQELAKQGAEVANMPLPTGPRTRELLKEASQSMDAAAKDLANRQPKPATDNQNEALARLEEAKKDLTEAAKKIEQRRDDIAKLEDSQQKLKELTNEQKQVAADAQKAAEQEKPDGEPVAQAQEKVTPPTRDVAKDLQQPAPDAAKSAQQAAEKMEAAKNDLQKNAAQDGAANAEQAAKELQRASEQVSKALAERRAQEAMDQVKMQPNQIDPAQAAREVAKAMDAANDASKSSDEAMQSPLTQDLARRQEKVAEMAKQSGQDKAAEPAQNAAKDLQKGDLQDAVSQQQKALNQLQKSDAKPNELAREQKSLMETTQALAKSMESTEMAQSAVQQAMAQSPEAIQQQLQQASKQLQEAGQQLQKSQPKQANHAQEQAKDALGQAMQALQQAAEMAQNTPPGQLQPGQQPQPSNQPDQQQRPGTEKGDQMATGDRKPDGVSKNVKAQSNGVEGDGSFLNLPPRQRELIRQALTEKLPPEYASFIQQYFVNVAKGKPAAPVSRDAKSPERSATPPQP